MKKLFLTLLTLLILPISVSADSDSFTYEIEDNLTLSQKVNGSGIFLGDNVDLFEEINGVGIILGNNINYKTKSNYALILGNNIDLSGSFEDGVILGNNVNLKEDSIITRDIVIFANELVLEGNINRDIVIYANNVVIKNANIARNIKIQSQDIKIENNTKINGILTYNDKANISINDEAIINETKKIEDKIEKQSIWEIILNHVTTLISLLVLFAVSLFIIPSLYKKIKLEDMAKKIGYGLLALILLPLVSLILIFTTFGLSLGLVILNFYILIITTSTIITGYMIGQYLWDKFIKLKPSPYLKGLLGISILYIIKSLPLIGGLISLFSILIAEGTIISLFKKKK